MHIIYKYQAFHKNKQGKLSESLKLLEESNIEGLKIEGEEVTREVLVSILENYLNISYAYNHFGMIDKSFKAIDEGISLGTIILN